MGRPSKFNTALTEKMISLYTQGKTDTQVARIIGVSERTINNWKGKHPEFLQSLKDSKEVADQMVEASLFARAVGYSHPEEKVFQYEGQIITHKTIKHYPPDTTAAIFWLKNRQPENWRDAQAMEISSSEKTQGSNKSFEDFCAAAGYPKPFAKQIEMMEFGISDDDPRLLLGARGYGKSDYVTVLGVAYDVYLNGSTTSNLIISKSKTRNSAMLAEIGNALKANGIKLDKQNSNCIRVSGLIGKDHSVEVITIKSSFRGRHPKRIIMDDPVTEEDTSDAMRQLVKKKYDEAYKLCKNIVIIGQPAHKHDLYQELRPALKKMEVPHGSIPELDADLEAMKVAGVDSRSIEMSYHLRVPSEGSTPFDNIRYIDRFPTGDSAVAFIDPSHEGGDYTALSIVKAHMDGIAVVGFVYKKAWNHCLDDMAPRLKQFNVRKLAFETNALGDMPIDILRNLFPAIGIVGRRSNNNKHARIMAAGAYAHLIHLSRESDKLYTDHVVQYEYKAKFDDAPDSLATCLEWIGLIRGKK